ncbi:MAG: methyltransferase domain-containing protein [Patescibacteria group bacterium]
MQKRKKENHPSAEKYFRRYLRIGPLSLALWRAVEAKHLSRIKLEKPVLDIGCGFGEFALAFAEEPIDMGIDNYARDLYIASKTGKYKNLTLADARELPFADNTYGSVFSISTLEHIENSDKVLKELYRVLKPGGTLFLTLETDEVDGATFYRPLLKKNGLGFLSDMLTKQYNALFHRHTLLPKKVWRGKIEKAGFVIETYREIISSQVTKLFDKFIIFAWPSQLSRPFIGKRVVFRPKFVEDILTKRFLKYVDEEEKEGTNLLIIAKKPLKKK